MKIINLRTIDGPNVFNYKPVVIMTVDLGPLHEQETCAVPGFNARLLELLPGLREHVCAKGYPGGFVERLEEGTYFGHAIEHAAIEIGQALGVTGNHGKTVRSATPHCFDIVVSSVTHPATRHLLKGVATGVAALAAGESWSVDAVREEVRDIAARAALGPSTQAIVDAAANRNIPWKRLNGDSLIQLGYGRERRLIQSAMTDGSSAIAVEVVQDKARTKEMLARAFVPVPEGSTVHTVDEAVALMDTLTTPLVVKPLDGNQGKGVMVGVATEAELRKAFAQAQQYSSGVVVEEQFKGHDYRVLCVNGKVVAASRRDPPSVTGDGGRSIADLVAEANADPRRGTGHEKPLTRIPLDEAAVACLQRHDLSPDAVPPAGRCVPLRENANLSTGGTATDVTDDVHPDMKALCERAARVVGLDICGVDLIAQDISTPPRPGEGVIELNAAPGLRMHVHPSAGAPRDVGGAIVDALFPDRRTGRIPLISITGTNGKTTVTRMVALALQRAGRCVGMTTTDGVWVGGRPVARGDMTGPRSAQAVLSDPAVEVAVLETARGGIVRTGLGYDWSDVGVITNIQLDHIGQDGIETLEDIAHIKSLVAERVRAGGTLIVNADDPEVMRILDSDRVQRHPRETRLFTLDPSGAAVRAHIAGGGTAYLPQDGWIVEQAGIRRTPMVEIAAMPATFGGTAAFQIANAMAAVAVCRTQGVPIDVMAGALSEFGGHAHNEGRGNLFRVGSGYVMLDYGHNVGALEAVGRMARLWHGRRVTAILGLPGDRADWLIEQSARTAAQVFDRIIVREDVERRGRAAGEMAGILCRTISRHRPALDCQTVHDEVAALRLAVESMAAHEVIVLFFEKHLGPIRQALQACGAVPTDRFEPVEGIEDATLGLLRRA